MRVETKIEEYGYKENEMALFGWQYTQEARIPSGRGSTMKRVYARDMDMPNYAAISVLEKKYLGLKRQKKYYESIDPLICVLLFFLFVFPLVIYVAVKKDQKQKIESFNAEIQHKMDDIAEEAKSLIVQ